MRKINFRKSIAYIGAICGMTFVVGVSQAQALTPIPPPDPIPGSYGLEATKPTEPPKVGATISTPGNGSNFSTSPITVTGICPQGLLVEIYNNNVMVGAVMCEDGSFSIEVSLFAGANEIKARVYDDLNQVGPESNVMTVNYNNTSFTAFGELITLTSSFGRRAAPVGTTLTWPLQLSGGTGPYAFSIDWGDGSRAELKSQALPGDVNIQHTYKQAGIYYVSIMVTDSNGVSAFLQLVAVSSGEADSAVVNGRTSGQGDAKPEILWWPMVVLLLLLLPTYWIGRRSQLVSIRNKMIKERDEYLKEERKKGQAVGSKNVVKNA